MTTLFSSQVKGARLHIREGASNLSHRPVEPRTGRHSQIVEELRRPGLQVTREEASLTRRTASEHGRVKLTDRETRHNFTKAGDVVFGLMAPVDTLNSHLRKIAPQVCQRSFVQETSEIEGGVGQKLAAPDADEEFEILLLDLFGRPLPSRASQNPVRLPEGSFVAFKLSDCAQHLMIGCRRQNA